MAKLFDILEDPFFSLVDFALDAPGSLLLVAAVVAAALLAVA